MSKFLKLIFTILLHRPRIALTLVEFYLKFVPYDFKAEARVASLYFRCGYFGRSMRHYQRILQKGDFIELAMNSSHVENLISLYEKISKKEELKRFVAEFNAKKNYDHLTLCRFLASMGEFEACAARIEEGKQKFGFYLPYQQELRVLNISEFKDLKEDVVQRLTVDSTDETFKLSDPSCFQDDGPYLVHELLIPKEELFVFKKVHVVGANNLVKDNSLLVFDKAGNPADGFIAGSWIYLTGSVRNPNHALVHYPMQKIEKIDKAILVGGRCASNYFHFLIEYISRFHAYPDLQKHLSLIPLIVDSSMPRQHFEALDLIFGKDVPRIYFSNSQVLEVNQLYLPSFHTYIPDQFEVPFWQCSGMSQRRLKSFREMIFQKMNFSFDSVLNTRRKLYLSRSLVGNRSILNQKEIERIFKAFGYEIVFPENLSFQEQIRLFASASHIAGPAGAAFANVIFCQPGTQIISLIGEHNKKYSLVSALCEVFDLKYINITGGAGRPPYYYNSPGDFVHAPFKIDPEKLKKGLRSLEIES